MKESNNNNGLFIFPVLSQRNLIVHLRWRTDLLRLSLLPHKNLCFSYSTDSNVRRFDYNSLVTVKRRRNLLLPKRRRHLLRPHSAPNLVLSNSLETERLTQNDAFRDRDESSALLDVSGMMCGGCVSRVKSLLSADDRVDSAVVNMLTETAVVKLKPEVAKANNGFFIFCCGFFGGSHCFTRGKRV
uniref:HMA domain-containing protein n=1 Tax=Fagus sylvatica TaxID=28930 RepID=A0A2N9GWQ0_FAGSY